jgi:hypothetical protein
MKAGMRIFVSTAIAAALLAMQAPAGAAAPPYAALAKALGTPVLGDSFGPADKSQLLLKFVPSGQTTKNWKKMTTVSILKVAPGNTDTATRAVITRLQAELKTRHATVRAFDRSPASPVTCYFEFVAGGDTEKGIVYSPDPGFVTVAQVGAKNGGSISSDDVKRLKSVIGR